MFRGDEVSHPAAVLRAAFDHAGIGRTQLHVEHVAVGGSLASTRLWSIVEGGADPTRREYDTIAIALNCGFVDRGLGHVVPYYDEL